MIPSLATFALEAISNCVHNATFNLLSLSLDTSIVDFESQHLTPSCKYMEKLISDIPSNLANDVWEKLLICVVRTSSEFVVSHRHFLHPPEKTHLNIAIAITYSILHPSVSKLMYSTSSRYSDFENEFYIAYIGKALQKVDSVNILALETRFPVADIIRNNKEKLKNLEELIICREDILQELPQVCPILKKLVFKYSNAFSFRSVDIISSLKHLEHLDITLVPVNPSQVTQIIEKLSYIQNDSGNAIHSLKTFKSVLTEDQALLLVERFPHLGSLKIVLKSRYSLIALKALNELRNLEVQGSVNDVSFPAILKEYLKECGNQLLELKLINIPGTDLNFIAQWCPSLLSLGLTYRNQDDLGFPYGEPLHVVNLCEFLNIKYCEFDMNSYDLMQVILSKCLNLEKALMKTDFDFLRYDTLKFFSQNMSDVKFAIRLRTGDTLHIWGNYKILSYLNGRTQNLTNKEMLHRFPNFTQE